MYRIEFHKSNEKYNKLNTLGTLLRFFIDSDAAIYDSNVDDDDEVF